MRTPDGWVRWYANEAQSLGPPHLNPVAQTGRLYAPKCGCGSKLRHTKGSGLSSSEVCGHCGKAWEYEDRDVLKGAFDFTRRTNAAEDRLTPFVDVGRLLGLLLAGKPTHDGDTTPEQLRTLRGFDVRVYIAHCAGYSIREITQAAPREFPQAPFLWYRDRVAKMIHDGRACWAAELQRAGIMEGGEWWRNVG